MELAELLEREDLDGDEVLNWARERADVLIAELEAGDDELLQLLESDVQIDVEALAARPEPQAPDPTPALGLVHQAPDEPVDQAPDEPPVDQAPDEPVNAETAESPAAELHAPTEAEAEIVDEQPTRPITLPIDEPEPESQAELADTHDEAPEDEPLIRGRRRVPSTPQPLSADELPPPPEHLRLADGEPEPILETVDTGPLELGTPEADAMIAATSVRAPIEFDMDVDEGDDDAPLAREDAAPAPIDVAGEAPSELEAPPADEQPSASEAASDEDSEDEDEDSEDEEFELVEIDDEELELVEEVEDAAPPSPPPPPPPGGAPPPPPPKPAAADDDGFDIDMD